MRSLKNICLACCLAILLAACSAAASLPASRPASASSKPAPTPMVDEEDVLATIHTPEGDMDIDLTTLQKVYDYADIVVVGTIDGLTKAEYRPEFQSYGDIPLSSAALNHARVVKGKVPEVFQLYICGGYLPAEEYIAYQVERSLKNGSTHGQALAEKYPPDARVDKFFHVTFGDALELKNDGTYILFLKQWSDGKITPAGCALESIEIQDGKALYTGEDYDTLEQLGIL